MNTWFIGLCLVTIPIIGNAAMRGAGDSFSPSMIMVLAAVVNLILDPIFDLWIFGRTRTRRARRGFGIGFSVWRIDGRRHRALIFPKKLLFQSAPQWSYFWINKAPFSIALPAGMANMLQPLSNAIIVALLLCQQRSRGGVWVAVRIQSLC